MKTISLDMTITAEQARAEWEDLPESTLPHIKDSYWRRYCRRKEGMSNPVTYTVAESPTASFKERPLHVPPGIAAKLTARKAQVQTPAPAKPAADLKPQKPIARNPRQNIGRAPGIDPADYPAIHARILQAARELGYGDLQSGGTNKIHGAAAAFTRAAAIPGTQSFHDTVTTGRKIWPKVIEQIARGIGISREWMLHGAAGDEATEGMFNSMCPIRFKPRPTVTERRNQIIAAAAPELATKYPSRRTLEEKRDAIMSKRPPGGVLFDALVLNADQTFSVIGPRAFTSAFAA